MAGECGHASVRHEAILAAAEKVFGDCGYAQATMEAVAERAGVSKGSLYNYFRSKRDLFLAVFAAAMAGEEAGLSRRLEMEGQASAGEKIEHLFDYWFDRLGRYLRLGRLGLELWATAARQGREDEPSVGFRRLYVRWRGQLGEIVAEGIRNGEFGADLDPQVAASLILAVLDGITVQVILETGVVVDEGFLAALKRGVLAGLRSPRAGKDASPAS